MKKLPKLPPHFKRPNPHIPRAERLRRIQMISLCAVLAFTGVAFLFKSMAATNPNLKGDLNNDNKVTVSDLSILLSNFNKSGDAADLNGDGKVTVADLSILLTNFNKTSTGNPTPTPPTPTPPTPTPPTPPTPTPPTPSTGSGSSRMVQITFYGTYDNDPKGSMAIAHPVIHDKVGGVGTYADPLTFASPSGTGSYKFGQIIYVPSVQKYFIKEDECAVSWTAPDGCGDVDMVDLYVGNPSDSQKVVACEDSLTKDGDSEIIVDPDPNRTVDPTPLWDQATGKCGKLH